MRSEPVGSVCANPSSVSFVKQAIVRKVFVGVFTNMGSIRVVGKKS